MIPIKIQCGCGQKYAFELEPADGRLACAVQCPACRADGTAAADQLIAEHLAASSGGVATRGARLCLKDQPQRLQTESAADAEINSNSPPQPAAAAPHTAALRENPRNARASWLVPAIGGGGVLALLLAGVVVWRSHGEKHEAASTITATHDGLPHTLVELNAWYIEPPAGQNAATFHSRGFDALQIANVGSSTLHLLGKGKLPPPGSPMPASMKSALAAVVHSNQDALRLFAEGANHEQSRYPVDLANGYDAVLPHLSKLRNALPVVELSAILHAENRDGKQAGNDLLLALALARSLEAEPLHSSQSVRWENVSVAVAALEQTVNRISLPRESLAELTKAFQKMEAYDARGDGFNRALAGERAIAPSTMETPPKLLQTFLSPGVNIPAGERSQIVARLQKAGNLKEEQQYYEQSFQQLMSAREKAFPDRLQTADVIHERVAAAADRKLFIIGQLLGNLEKLVSREASSLARERLGLSAVALEQFRAAHNNRYPDALPGLTPEYLSATPVDPFDGQPLRYRKKGSGYLLYSIGPDLKDDSGERMIGKEGDIAFEVITSATP